MSVSTSRFSPLTVTSDNLGDIESWIKKGNVVALHTTEACKVFHSIDFERPESPSSLKDRRVIYVNCNSNSNLLLRGEWDDAIKASIPGVTELRLDHPIRMAIIGQKRDLVPNQTRVNLGY